MKNTGKGEKILTAILALLIAIIITVAVKAQGAADKAKEQAQTVAVSIEPTENKTQEVPSQEEEKKETGEAAQEEEQAEYIPSTKAEDGYISELQIMEITSEVGSLYNICPELLQAICYHESRYCITAENDTCKGLMQLNINYMAERMERLGVTDIYDEYSNVLLAADYIAELRDTTTYGDDLYYVLMRYNMTTATANEFYEQGKVSAYAENVAAYAMELERLHGK